MVCSGVGSHLRFSPSRQAMTSSSPRTPSSTVMTALAGRRDGDRPRRELLDGGVAAAGVHVVRLAPEAGLVVGARAVSAAVAVAYGLDTQLGARERARAGAVVARTRGRAVETGRT